MDSTHDDNNNHVEFIGNGIIYGTSLAFQRGVTFWPMSVWQGLEPLQ